MVTFLNKLVGAQESDRFVFTSSGIEALNHVLFAAYLDVTRKTGKNHYVTCQKGILAHTRSFERLQELGCSVTFSKNVTLNEISECLTPRTALVSLSWADPLTGEIFEDLCHIAKVCKLRGIIFHVDLTEVIGKGHFPWELCGADVVTFDGEALLAPQGTGALFMREGFDMSPFICGGEEQGGMRGGKINPLLMEGLEKAAEKAFLNRDFLCVESARLKADFEHAAVSTIEDVQILCDTKERLPHVSALVFKDAFHETLLFYLHRKGIKAQLGPHLCSLTFTAPVCVKTLQEAVAKARRISHAVLE